MIIEDRSRETQDDHTCTLILSTKGSYGAAECFSVILLAMRPKSIGLESVSVIVRIRFYFLGTVPSVWRRALQPCHSDPLSAVDSLFL